MVGAVGVRDPGSMQNPFEFVAGPCRGIRCGGRSARPCRPQNWGWRGTTTCRPRRRRASRAHPIGVLGAARFHWQLESAHLSINDNANRMRVKVCQQHRHNQCIGNHQSGAHRASMVLPQPRSKARAMKHVAARHRCDTASFFEVLRADCTYRSYSACSTGRSLRGCPS